MHCSVICKGRACFKITENYSQGIKNLDPTMFSETAGVLEWLRYNGGDQCSKPLSDSWVTITFCQSIVPHKVAFVGII